MDADEELSSLSHLPPRLEETQTGACRLRSSRKTWYLGAWIKHSGWYPDFQRRLYRRDAAKFSGIIHEALRIDGKPGRLIGDLLHYTVHSFDEHQTNVERYSTLAAQQMFANGSAVGAAQSGSPRPGAGFRISCCAVASWTATAAP